MPEQRNREEVVNTQLAILISKLGVTAEAETIHVHGKHRPDVLFELRGLRIAIEGKIADHPGAEAAVLNDARQRVLSGIAHIACAVIYPLPLRNASTTKMLSILQKSQLKYRIVSETGETGEWFEGNPNSLMDALRHAQEALTKDDIVESTAVSLSIRLEGVAKLWMGQQGACDRLSTILGLTPPKGEIKQKADERRETAAKVSALVLANAFIFQEQLARTNGQITSLRKLEKSKDPVGTASEHWKWISENINYTPIFQLGERVLTELPINANSRIAVQALLTEAISICSQQAALRHDLMGRIYHWLLHHAKYLGTYYTAVSSATLLLKLTMAAKWKQDFSNPIELAAFKVADLACGTGTLLMASAQALSDVYIRERAEKDLPLDLKDMSTLHRALMENVLYGYDVLPSAVHLTASTLAMLAPEVAFVRMGLFVMPMGIDHGIAKLGSLDFLTENEVKTQMALDYSHTEIIQTGAGFSSATKASLPKLDLCVMNPPFVRSVGGNLLFGSLPDERGRMQTELKKRVKSIGASATAGLGSVFVALADRWLNPDGRLAFVLPAALASGEAWGDTRKLIADKYDLETVVSSHDAERPNFSENTELSEILFIAQKRNPKNPAQPTTYISLWRNPRSIHEALDLANRITQINEVASIEGDGITTIKGTNAKLGEMVKTPAAKERENWTGALFAQSELLRAFWTFKNGEGRIPGVADTFLIPVCELKTLGGLGYDRRDIHDAFEISKEDWSPYAAFWDHDSKKVITIGQKANMALLARTKAAKGRHLKSATDVWSKAARILVVERLRANTHRVLAVGFEKEVLGNTWWALKLNGLTTEQEKALLLWLNSTPAILLFFGRRVVTQGAWMQMKKPGWETMPVLDVRILGKKQINQLAKFYDAFSVQNLEPLAKLNSDPVRMQIDNAISHTLDIPTFDFIRELLDREPGMNATDIVSHPGAQSELPNLDDDQESLF